MYEVFRNYLDNKIALTPEQHAAICRKAVVKKLRKKQYLLQEGEFWRNHAFVSKGLVRTYSVDEKGCEHIIAFAMENWWTGDREALLSGQPTRFNIDAIEDSEIVLFEKSTFERISKDTPEFNDLVNVIIDRSFVASQTRIHDAISLTAEERYVHWVQRYPAYAARVPQNMIASYLGISRETLSRIRHKLSKKL